MVLTVTPANAAAWPMVIPSVMTSVNLAVLDGGDFAHGRGDGTEILAHDARVVARDRRAHLDVRVPGEHRVQCGTHRRVSFLGGTQGGTRAHDKPHREGHQVECGV